MTSIRDLIPLGRNTQAPAADRDNERNPFLSLHREMNRLFDGVFRNYDLGLPAGRAFANWPSIEVADEDKAVRITADLPGLDEKDIEVILEDGTLTQVAGGLPERDGILSGIRRFCLRALNSTHLARTGHPRRRHCA